MNEPQYSPPFWADFAAACLLAVTNLKNRIEPMKRISVELVRRANRRYLFNKKNDLPNSVPKKDIWGNDFPSAPVFPFKFYNKEEKMDS